MWTLQKKGSQYYQERTVYICAANCPEHSQTQGLRWPSPLTNAEPMICLRTNFYLTKIVMAGSISPLGFKNVNNKLKTCLIEHFLSPSQLFQAVVYQGGGELAAVSHNAKHVSNEPRNVIGSNTSLS